MERLKACGINIQKGYERYGDEYLTALRAFINGYDFMRLGQAVNKGQWESARMACRRMSMKAEALGLECFGRQFLGLRLSLASKNDREAKNILSVIMPKRIQIQKILKEIN